MRPVSSDTLTGAPSRRPWRPRFRATRSSTVGDAPFSPAVATVPTLRHPAADLAAVGQGDPHAHRRRCTSAARPASSFAVTTGVVEVSSVTGAPGARGIADLGAVLADARRPVADDDLRARDRPALREVAIVLEVDHRGGRRRGPVVVDGAGVVAERLQVALELADVAAVGHAGAEVAVHRDRAVEDPGRRLGVDRHQRAPARDGVALVAQARDRARGRGGRLGRVGEAERAVDVLAGDEVAALDRGGAERHARRWRRRCRGRRRARAAARRRPRPRRATAAARTRAAAAAARSRRPPVRAATLTSPAPCSRRGPRGRRAGGCTPCRRP